MKKKHLSEEERGKNLAARVYLDLSGPIELAPEWEYARWYHLLWFLVPIAGPAFFVAVINAKRKK